jgi:hypothetical protein
VLDPQPIGSAIREDDTGMKDAVAAAIDAMYADGTMQSIVAKWGMTEGVELLKQPRRARDCSVPSPRSATATPLSSGWVGHQATGGHSPLARCPVSAHAHRSAGGSDTWSKPGRRDRAEPLARPTRGWRP